jgi:hypothetical protein
MLVGRDIGGLGIRGARGQENSGQSGERMGQILHVRLLRPQESFKKKVSLRLI